MPRTTPPYGSLPYTLSLFPKTFTNYNPKMCESKKEIILVFLFGGEILSNFNLENQILSYLKDFSWKKLAQIRQISEIK